jgi:hypothetical protein
MSPFCKPTRHEGRIVILRASGFVVDHLREVCAPPDATNHPCYQLTTVDWAR